MKKKSCLLGNVSCGDGSDGVEDDVAHDVAVAAEDVFFLGLDLASKEMFAHFVAQAQNFFVDLIRVPGEQKVVNGHILMKKHFPIIILNFKDQKRHIRRNYYSSRKISCTLLLIIFLNDFQSFNHIGPICLIG